MCVQERHSAQLPDHHPGEEVSQSHGVPGGAAEHLGGCKSQVGGGTWRHTAVNTAAVTAAAAITVNAVADAAVTTAIVSVCSVSYILNVGVFLLSSGSMTELEKDIGNVRSGLTNVERVSHQPPYLVESLWRRCGHVGVHSCLNEKLCTLNSTAWRHFAAAAFPFSYNADSGNCQTDLISKYLVLLLSAMCLLLPHSVKLKLHNFVK